MVKQQKNLRLIFVLFCCAAFASISRCELTEPVTNDDVSLKTPLHSLDLMQNLIPKRKSSEHQRTTSEEYLVLKEEDREAAKCLIHMARGGWAHLNIRNGVMYECNICKRSFDSYQALGGHRGKSHKRRKTTTEEEKTRQGCHLAQLTDPTGKIRVHECLICGTEFPSGPALGGHMARHRDTVDTKADSVSGTQSDINLY